AAGRLPRRHARPLIRRCDQLVTGTERSPFEAPEHERLLSSGDRLTAIVPDHLHPRRRASDTVDASALFHGGGELGQRMAAFDWSTTSLGPVERWPQSLR